MQNFIGFLRLDEVVYSTRLTETYHEFIMSGEENHSVPKWLGGGYPSMSMSMIRFIEY